MISCICLFLTFAVAVTASITFSKYISVSNNDKLSAAGSFYCSGSVGGVSSLAFANLDFWGGTEGDIPMNSVHSLDFLINNYETVTDAGGNEIKAVSAVKMKYTLIFSSPEIFVRNLAMQLFDDSGDTVTPQIVIADLFNTGDGMVYNTADSTEYGGTAHDEFSFTVNRETTVISGTDVTGYTAIAALPDGSGNIAITFEPFYRHITQTLKFRLWDVSGITSPEYPVLETDGGGELIDPLYADISTDILCYRISISMPQFELAAGVEEQDAYSLRFVTTSAIDDYQLGGYLTENASGDILQSIHSGKTVYMKTLVESVTDTDSEGNTTVYDSYYVFGNPKVYTDGVEYTDPVTDYEFGATRSSNETVSGTTGNNAILYFDSSGNIVDSSSAEYYVTVSKAPYTTETNTVREVNRECYMSVTRSQKITTNVVTSGSTETITRYFETTTNYNIPAEYIDTQTYTRTTVYENYKGSVEKAYKKNGSDWENIDKSSLPAKVETLTLTESGTQTPTEYNGSETSHYTRTIVRVTSWSSQITFADIYRYKDDGLGNITYTKYDSSENAFKLFDENGIQKYFISQCYSKSYPLRVNVIFEQIQ